LALDYISASEALHVLIQLDAGNTVTYLRPLHQRGPTTGPQATCGAGTEFLWPADFLTIDCCVDIKVGNFRTRITAFNNNNVHRTILPALG